MSWKYNKDLDLSRLRVHGGWLVRAIEYSGEDDTGVGVGLTFVLDPDGKWNWDKPQVNPSDSTYKDARY